MADISGTRDPKKSIFDVGIRSDSEIEIEIINPHLGLEPRQFSQGAQVVIRSNGQETQIDISDGLYRILPNLDLPIRNLLRQWQVDSPYSETYIDHFAKSFYGSINTQGATRNLNYIIMSLPREVKDDVAKLVQLLVDDRKSYELILSGDSLQDITPEFSELCDTVIAKISNYPNLYSFLTRARITPLDVDEFKLIAQRIISLTNDQLAIFEFGLNKVREAFEENIKACITAAFQTLDDYEFSIDQIFGRVLARNGKIFIPPSAPAVIANTPGDGPSKLITPDQVRATNALLCSYSIRCAQFSNGIDDAFHAMFSYLETATDQAKSVGDELPNINTLITICEEISDSLAQEFTGWDPQTYSWIHSPIAEQGFDYRGTEGFASALFGARIDSPTPLISFKYL